MKNKVLKIILIILTIIIVATAVILVSCSIDSIVTQSEKVENYLVEKYGFNQSELKVMHTIPHKLFYNSKVTLVETTDVNGKTVNFRVFDVYDSPAITDEYFDRCLGTFVEWKVEQLAKDVGLDDNIKLVGEFWRSVHTAPNEIKKQYDNEYMLDFLKNFEAPRGLGYTIRLHIYCNEVDEKLARDIFKISTEIYEEMINLEGFVFLFYGADVDTFSPELEEFNALTEDEFCDVILG